MNPDIDYPNNSNSEAKELDENIVQENPSVNFEMNDEVDLQPQYLHQLWTQLMSLTRINLSDANSTQPITI